MVATLSALVLGLLIASAKGSYDSQTTELTELSARVVFLDRVLAHYGPDTREARERVALQFRSSRSRPDVVERPYWPAPISAKVLWRRSSR
jgi:hypothetical protein